MRFYEQLERQHKLREDDDGIKPDLDWEKTDYVELHRFYENGWLIGGIELGYFIIDPDYERDEKPWEPSTKSPKNEVEFTEADDGWVNGVVDTLNHYGHLDEESFYYICKEVYGNLGKKLFLEYCEEHFNHSNYEFDEDNIPRKK